MTDPTPTRAEVETILRYHFNEPDDYPISTTIGHLRALRERAEAAEAERKAADFRLVDRYRNPKTGIFNFPDDVAAIVRALDEARRAEAAAWNDAIEAAAERLTSTTAMIFTLGDCVTVIRALRRAAPTEGEA